MLKPSGGFTITMLELASGFTLMLLKTNITKVETIHWFHAYKKTFSSNLLLKIFTRIIDNLPVHTYVDIKCIWLMLALQLHMQYS